MPSIICEADKIVKSSDLSFRHKDVLYSRYRSQRPKVVVGEDGLKIQTEKIDLCFKTDLKLPRLGVMFVGIGGNNGSTFAATHLANKMKLSWETRRGMVKANWYGAISQCGTCKIGETAAPNASATGAGGDEIYVPLKNILPLINPDDLVIGGWDINGATMSEAMKRAGVLPIEVQRMISSKLDDSVGIFPGIYDADFIASNQEVRADRVIAAKKKSKQLKKIQSHIKQFRESKKLDSVIVIWNGNTERFSEHLDGVHDTAENLLKAIERNESEISPSLLYCVASILSGCAYINGSPQNTFCPGVVELARTHGVYLAGDDLKTGQTKFKSVITDFMISTALKPTAIVSYNHLGNNDGLNLSSEKQFKSKEITKASVVDDMIASNNILFPEGEKHPDHLIVIKYVPAVGDSKRALDEYTASICMNGDQTIVVHNTCEDSLLAAPIILDLVIFMELLQRITINRSSKAYEIIRQAKAAEVKALKKKKRETKNREVNTSSDSSSSSSSSSSGDDEVADGFEKLDTLQSLLSMFLKAPKVPDHAPVINALFPQREALIDFIKAAAGISTADFISLGYRLKP